MMTHGLLLLFDYSDNPIEHFLRIVSSEDEIYVIVVGYVMYSLKLVVFCFF